MTKYVIKFSLGAAGIVLVGLGALYGLRFFDPEYRQEQEAMRKLEEVQQQYQNDTYGGDTPEETLRLFIDALKKEDIDLAAKYFVFDKQGELKKELQVLRNKGLFSITVQDLETMKKPYTIGEGDNIQFIFEAYNEKKQLVLQMTIIKNLNGIWKIEDM